jgi:hypothetical protein
LTGSVSSTRWAHFSRHGDDAGFERGDLAETPLGVDNGLDEVVFVVVGGGVFGEEAVDVFLVDGGVFGG